MKCKHESKMYTVYDRNGWAVGTLCDCGYFIHRKDIPSYDGRIKLNKEIKKL